MSFILLRVLVLALCTGLGVLSAEAQSTWRTDSLMTTWPVQQMMQELGTSPGRGVVRAVDTKDLYAKLTMEAPGIPAFADDEVITCTDLYGQPQREQFRALLGMSIVHFPLIEKALAENGLPADLKYLPMALSAMNPEAGSHDGGAGLWMLTYPIALRYGLAVTADIDERHDPAKSTAVAMRYLKDLYARYKDPSLAIMAFACGPANVQRAQQRAGGATDIRSLYPHFTEGAEEVFPLLMAFIHLTANAAALGIEPMDLKTTEPIDTMRMDRELQLPILARVLQLPEARLRWLNPTLCGLRVPAHHPLMVPAGMGPRYAQHADSLERLATQASLDQVVNTNLNTDQRVPITVKKTIRYRVRSGDNLGAIATRHHVTITQLKAWNGLRSDRINAGQTLVIHTKKREWVKPTPEPEPQLPEDEGPTNSTGPGTIPTNTSRAQAATGVPLTSYTVQSGDSLYRIAQRFPGITVKRIMEVNGITSSIHPGQHLTIPLP